MKKILQVTCILAILLFFLAPIGYQTSRMTSAVNFPFHEVLLGKTFIAGGVQHNSGFNLYALAAIGCAVLAAVLAWVLRKPMAIRIGVLVPSVLAIVFYTLSLRVFDADAVFATSINSALSAGIEFKTSLGFAVTLSAFACNALFCVTTKRFADNFLRYKWFFLMLIPAALYFIVFLYIPMVGLAIVFLDYNIKDIFQSTWVGLKWFRLLFQSLDGEFGKVVVNTVVVAFGRMLVCFPAPILLALMFNECRHIVYKRVIQTVSYLPHFLSWSIIGGLIIQLASSQYSIVNGILRIFGGTEYYLLNEVGAIRPTLIFSNLWKSVGWGTIIYMAALTNVNPELYESATLDGAGRLAQTWHITLPGISHIIVMQLIFATPGLLHDNFDQALNLVYPMTVEAGKTLSMYTYEIGIRGRGNLGLGGNYSFSTAIGLVNSILSFFLLMMANQVGKRINEEGAIW